MRRKKLTLAEKRKRNEELEKKKKNANILDKSTSSCYTRLRRMLRVVRDGKFVKKSIERGMFLRKVGYVRL